MELGSKKARKLRDKAEKLRRSGNAKKACELYYELCELEPEEPRWPQQAAEMHRQLGEHEKAVKGFIHSAELYHTTGFGVKCVAMCKVILSMDPLNAVANRLLEEVSGSRPARLPMPGELSPDPPPSTAEVAMASTGGNFYAAPPEPKPAPPTVAAPPPAPPRKPTRETSPKELQTLNLSDLQTLLGHGEPGSSAGHPAVPPPPPIPSEPPQVLVDAPPRQQRPPAPPMPSAVPGSATGRRPLVPQETLDISIDIEELEASFADTPKPDAGEMEIMGSDVGFMAGLESSEISETRKARRNPTLEANAPLETLDLEDIMPGRQRKSSGTVSPNAVNDLFEIPLEEEETLEVTEEAAEDEYRRRLTPSKQGLEMPPPGLFKSLGIDAMKSLVTQMTFMERAPGQTILRQGEIGGSLFVIVRGEVAIIREIDGRRIQVTTLSDGAFFGEMALITDTPRLATVEAVTQVELFEISRDTVGLLIQQHPQVVPVLIKFLKDRLLESFVKTSDLLSPVPEQKRWLLARKFRLFEIKPGKVIVKEGEPSGGLMIFLAGSAVATRNRRGQKVSLGELGPGSIAGEISLLTGGPAVATVTATSKAWLLVISTKQWRALTNAFPTMRDYLEKLAAERRQENAAIIAGDANYTSQSIRIV